MLRKQREKYEKFTKLNKDTARVITKFLTVSSGASCVRQRRPSRAAIQPAVVLGTCLPTRRKFVDGEVVKSAGVVGISICKVAGMLSARFVAVGEGVGRGGGAMAVVRMNCQNH